jgi:hypothetical protein
MSWVASIRLNGIAVSVFLYCIIGKIKMNDSGQVAAVHFKIPVKG